MAWSVDEIINEAKVLEDQAKQFKHDLYKMIWYMRGSVTVDDIYQMSYEDREMIGRIVKENLDTTKKSGLPFF